ncbi:MAG: hypothetical protein M0D55_08290 [Elusimicrobiota bacterium]|nr:MAG: hypothetical protein M0D55_08290 [Elusimicrobiota bacterium]
MVEASGIKRLARPASPEPSVSTIAVAGRKAYIHEGAVWLAKADGRPAPALLVDGVWRLYEVKDGSVLLRPAFPGLFAGRPDDPNLLLIADPAGRWVLRVEGVRASASLWADVSKPVHAAALGDGVAAASFKDGKVAVRRRDGASFVVQGLDRVEARRLPGGI